MDGNWPYWSDHFIMYKNTESLWYTPETNTVLYVNYHSVKKYKPGTSLMVQWLRPHIPFGEEWIRVHV